jgi:hypothetical protein
MGKQRGVGELNRNGKAVQGFGSIRAEKLSDCQ